MDFLYIQPNKGSLESDFFPTKTKTLGIIEKITGISKYDTWFGQMRYGVVGSKFCSNSTSTKNPLQKRRHLDHILQTEWKTGYHFVFSNKTHNKGKKKTKPIKPNKANHSRQIKCKVLNIIFTMQKYKLLTNRNEKITMALLFLPIQTIKKPWQEY
jgi:hypothetical protein